MLDRAKSFLREQLPQLVYFAGSEGRMLAAGGPSRMESIAATLCGDDAVAEATRRGVHARIPTRLEDHAAKGGIALIAATLAQSLPDRFIHKTVQIPQLVDLFRPLPGTIEDLQTAVRTSTTREDLRRIRKAGFGYSVSTDADKLREFHQRFVKALLNKRFPFDGFQEPLETALGRLNKGAELICLEHNGEWVAGIFNTVRGTTYELGAFGIKDGRDDIRRMHATSALLVKSFERGLELGLEKVWLGRSLPFLGKGPIWFKAKWGGVLKLDPAVSRGRILMDMRHPGVRKLLCKQPIVYSDGDTLALALWLEPGEKALKTTVRDADRFPGITRWDVMGDPETLSEGHEALVASPKINPNPVPAEAGGPLWLGEVLRRQLSHPG